MRRPPERLRSSPARTAGDPATRPARVHQLLLIGLVVLVAVVGLLVLAVPAVAAPEEGCLGGPVAVIGCLGDPGRLVGDAAQQAGQGVMGAVTRWVTEAARWMLEQVGVLVDAAGKPDLTGAGSGWWAAKYRLMLALAAVVAAATLLLALLDAMAKGSVAALGRALGVDVPVAAVVGGVAPVLIQYLVDVADWMTGRLLEGFAGDSAEGLAAAASWFAAFSTTPASTPVVPLFVAALTALLAVVAALLVFLELLLRANAIYLLAALVPVLYAVRVWPAARPLARKTTELLVALVFVQPVVALALALAAGAASTLDGIGEASLREFGTAIAGTVFLWLAALSPWAVVSMIPALEGAMAARAPRLAISGGTRSAVQLGYTLSYLGRMANARHGPQVWARGDEPDSEPGAGGPPWQPGIPPTGSPRPSEGRSSDRSPPPSSPSSRAR